MTDAAQEAFPEVTDSGTVLVSGLPFTFAQSRNVLLDRTASALTLFLFRHYCQRCCSKSGAMWVRCSRLNR